MSKFFIETYGCQMNTAESDSLKQIFLTSGHLEVSDSIEADIVLLNACSVRTTAERRIEGRIGYYRGINRKLKKNIGVILLGCVAQNIGEQLKEKFPDVVKVVWGTYNKENVVSYLNNLTNLTGAKDHLQLSGYEFMPAEPQKKYPFKAFAPISHGCDNFCSYCIVPYVRGRETHRASEDIIANIKRLVDEGVKEVNLLGQNVNSYKDNDLRFPQLLDKAASVPGLKRLTFLTSHPKDFSSELVEVMGAHDNIMNYIHLPFQAGSDRILKMMNRKYSIDDYMRKIETARKLDNAVLTTDIMVGFPTETDEEFEETMRIVETVRFHEAFMYRYNVRPGTAAENYDGQIPEEVKLFRLNALIETQNRITKELLAKSIGKNYSALCESVSKKDARKLTGRTHNGLPVFFEADESLIGSIVNVNITGVSGSGLKGKII